MWTEQVHTMPIQAAIPIQAAESNFNLACGLVLSFSKAD